MEIKCRSKFNVNGSERAIVSSSHPCIVRTACRREVSAVGARTAWPHPGKWRGVTAASRFADMPTSSAGDTPSVAWRVDNCSHETLRAADWQQQASLSTFHYFCSISSCKWHAPLRGMTTIAEILRPTRYRALARPRSDTCMVQYR